MENQDQNSIHNSNKNEKNLNKESKLSISNSCSKLKSVSKISELNVNHLRETSDFGKIDSYRENKSEEMNKIEIDKLTSRKKIKNNIIPLKVENLNPIK